MLRHRENFRVLTPTHRRDKRAKDSSAVPARANGITPIHHRPQQASNPPLADPRRGWKAEEGYILTMMFVSFLEGILRNTPVHLHNIFVISLSLSHSFARRSLDLASPFLFPSSIVRLELYTIFDNILTRNLLLLSS